MKVKIGSKKKDIVAVWWEHGTIKLIDQRLLPHNFKIYTARNYKEVATAIKTMVVRGAPAIGVTVAYGIAQAALQHKNLTKVSKILKATRPTAYDLFYAVEYMLSKIAQNIDPLESAENYANEIIENCRRIGVYGEKLIQNKFKILTHCNAGALATVDWGTALAPIRMAHYNGKRIFVFVDETRPRLQGAKLTAWELYNEGIAHAVIADNAAGYYMLKDEVDLVITGADRIVANGDFANKIGTYEKAVLAKENGIPFYVAAPLSTFDFSKRSGKEIPIENRSEDEVLKIDGHRLTMPGIKALNPAFDVTPNKYVTGIITEMGLFRTGELKKLKPTSSRVL